MRNHRVPSLNWHFGYILRRDQTNDNNITIVHNHYLKNIREELIGNKDNNSNNEIAYIIAQVNGIAKKCMIDTGANVSLIDSNEYHKIQKLSKVILPTLPINNIILIGATGRQNKTIKRQVSLEVTSNNITIPKIFLVANGATS